MRISDWSSDVCSSDLMKVAIYARHSTDKQEHSTRDQLARCHAHCQRFGYKVTATFCDEGISGAAMQNRPGIRGLIEAALDGVFTRIITEALSSLRPEERRVGKECVRTCRHGGSPDTKK